MAMTNTLELSAPVAAVVVAMMPLFAANHARAVTNPV
jgi:hypothetical protein